MTIVALCGHMTPTDEGRHGTPGSSWRISNGRFGSTPYDSIRPREVSLSTCRTDCSVTKNGEPLPTSQDLSQLCVSWRKCGPVFLVLIRTCLLSYREQPIVGGSEAKPHCFRGWRIVVRAPEINLTVLKREHVQHTIRGNGNALPPLDGERHGVGDDGSAGLKIPQRFARLRIERVEVALV